MQVIQEYYGNEKSIFVPQLLSKKADVLSYLKSNEINAVLFDCDGVLYRGSDAIPNASKSLSNLMKQGIKVFFVTNNAGSNRFQLCDKLSKLLHLDNLTVDQMVTSSYSAAKYLQRELQPFSSVQRKPRIHIIGTSGLCEEIRNAGFDVDTTNDAKCGMSREELAEYPFPQLETDAIVVGLDNDFNYRKLCIANVLLQQNPRALLVATNEDAYDLVGGDARHLPGNGALVKALEHCSQRKAVCVGKPSPLLAELIRDDHNLEASKCLFVGDRLDTDIRFGQESEMKSALVLTGCTTATKVVQMSQINFGHGSKEEPLPTIVMPHMGLL